MYPKSAYAVVILAAMLVASPLFAATEEKTIVVDSENPVKHKTIKADKRTKVINIKGKRDREADSARSGDVCMKMKGYYCSSLGKQAWLTINGMYLGVIEGVAWKEAGQPTGAYLGDITSGRPPMEWVVFNHLATCDGFYFIIGMADAQSAQVLVEPHRITIGDKIP